MEKEINLELLQNEEALKLSNNQKNDFSSENKLTMQKTKLINVGVALMIVIVIEYFTRDYSKVFTIQVFGSPNKDKCQLFEFYEFYNFGGRYLLCFLIFSYVNVYAALTYTFLDCFVVFINGIIRFFYLDDRPFWKHPEFAPCFCATDYGNPSTTGINLFIMFAVFYKAFTYKSNNKIFNWSIWIICALNVIYIYIVRMMQNIHYIHQLFYGLAIGYLIYYTVFDIFELDFDSSHQFLTLLESWKSMALIILGVFIFVTVIHLNLNLVFLTQEEIGSIEQNCKLNDLFSLDKESYSKSTRMFEFLGCFMGCWFEYVLVFKSNKELYTKYNVKSDHEMYRHTSSVISFIRFFIFFIVQRYLLSYLILGKANFESFPKVSFLTRLVFLQSIPLFIHGVIIFLVLKVLMPYVYLTNESIWAIKTHNMIQEDIEDTQKKLLQ